MRFTVNAALVSLITLFAVLTAAAQDRSPIELHALSPTFWNLVDHNAKLETVATGFGFTEGPMWDSAGFLYVSDETINKIFRIDADGKKTEVIALGDPDGKRFYVDDDDKRNIRVYDVASDGSLTNGRIFGEEPGGKHDGVPDGIKVDKGGNLFVTGPKGIWVWDAKGNHLGTIVMPEQPANLTWGDQDYKTLYITATTSLYRLEMKTQGFVPYLIH